MPTNSAVSSNTRATRSRFSSPQGAGGGGSGAADASRAQGSGVATTNGEGGQQKTFMQRWLEPPVQVKASYQDAGLIRQGVFENMAPLGTLPKVGLFKKTAPPPAATPEKTQVRRIVIKQKPAPPSTPAPPPPPAPEEDETQSDETEEEEEEEGGDDDDDDGRTEEQNEEETPGGDAQDEGADKENYKTRATAAARRSRRSLNSAETDDEEWGPGASTSQKPRTRRSASRASTGPQQQQQQAASGAIAGSRTISQKEMVGKVVEAAVEEALSHFRYPTAWALRTLYDENSSNQDFLNLIQKVFTQTANADELEDFARRLQVKKREGKKDNRACRHFVPAAADPDFTPHPPKRAPYGNLVKFDMSTLRLGERAGSKRPKRERPVKEEEVKAPVAAPAAGTAAAAAAEPEPERDAEPEPELPPRKKRKSARQHSAATASARAKMTTNGGKTSAETPSRRRTRARSMSSISSLSSARSLTPPDGIQEEDVENVRPDETPSRTSPAPHQPIKANKRRRSNAPRKARNVSTPRVSPAAASSTTAPQPPAAAAAAASTTTTTPSQRQSPAADVEEQPYEMPAVVDTPLFPNLNTKKGSKSAASSIVLATKVGKIDPDDPKLRLRQEARRKTSQAFPVSDVRESPPPAASEKEDREEPPRRARSARPATPATAPASRSRTAAPSDRPTPAPREGRSTRASLKRAHDELEDQSSPTTANFPGSDAASTAGTSRAGTPALRAPKKARTGLRVKNSPMKKKNGPSAGIPRPSGERSSPVGNTAREDDNDDYCSSCGGNGELLCCDGCTRSFHFGCVDPVLRHDAMPAEWFCNVCRTSRDPAHLPVHDGAFGLMLEKLDGRNSSAFRLPGRVRDRFEGVRTGADGEYEEVTQPVKPTRKKKSDEELAPELLYRVRDADGNAIICHGCQQGSASDRAIIPCSACGIFWHLDCLDPPLARAPVLRTWKCPLHADDLLNKLPALLHPAHKHRKVKDAPVIRPAFTRGYANNGFIDINFDDSDNESGWRDIETFGRTVRLSEKGIKLDFLSRIRDHAAAKPVEPKHVPATPVQPPRPFGERSLEEQQAALNLSQLSNPREDGVSALIDAMISQADPTVIDMMARVDASHIEKTQLSQMDQQGLRAILARAESITEQIRKLLASSQPPAPPTQDAVPTAPANQPAATASNTESDNSTNMDADRSAMETNETDAAKSPASPATTDDVPAMTQGEKTPVQGDQSPTAPLLLEESAPMANGGGVAGGIPATPTKAAALPGNEPVVLEAGGEAEGEGDKALAEGEGIGI